MLQDPYTKKNKKQKNKKKNKQIITPKGVQLVRISVQVKCTKVLDYKVRVDVVQHAQH